MRAGISGVLEAAARRVVGKGPRAVQLFPMEAKEIEPACSEMIEFYQGVLNSIANEPESSVKNTVKRLADAEGDWGTYTSSLYFPSYVDARKEARDASTEATKRIEAFQIECGMREDVYQAFRRLQSSPEGKQLAGLDKRFVEETLDDFERNGLGLPVAQRNELKGLRTRISELCVQFQQNINEFFPSLEFTREQLKGLPESFIGRLKTRDDKFLVTIKYPDLFPVMKLGQDPETRRRMVEASELIPENVSLLEEIIALRHKAAQLLGYRTHAEYVLKKAMAKTPEAVLKFLGELRDRLVPFAEKELKVLLELKKKECAENGWDFDGIIQPWDFRYYHTLLQKTAYELDEQQLKPYFPLDTVTAGMFRIYENMLGLRFEEVKNPVAWHPEVRLFAAHNMDGGDEPVGFFFMDLFPREGKYSHAAAFGLQNHYVRSDGTLQVPMAAMVANFTAPTADSPSLLEFSEVETYFHEFGHICHDLCSKSPVYRWSGTSVERDFVEAPSQMLENWCYDKEALQMMSGHFERPDEKLPEDFVRKIQAAKNLNCGLLNLRQVFFGMFDMTCHTQENVDTQSLWHELRRTVSLIPAMPGTNAASNFGHLTGGYDAGYYGYLYSEVFSADMFDTFKKVGIFSGEVGRRYRDLILARGRTVDSMDSLVEFLGREPSQDAFLRHLGILNE